MKQCLSGLSGQCLRPFYLQESLRFRVQVRVRSGVTSDVAALSQGQKVSISWGELFRRTPS